MIGALRIFGALVMDNQVLLRASSMEDMDLVVVPGTCSLNATPCSPNIGTSVVKSKAGAEQWLPADALKRRAPLNPSVRGQ